MTHKLDLRDTFNKVLMNYERQMLRLDIIDEESPHYSSGRCIDARVELRDLSERLDVLLDRVVEEYGPQIQQFLLYAANELYEATHTDSDRRSVGARKESYLLRD